MLIYTSSCCTLTGLLCDMNAPPHARVLVTSCEVALRMFPASAGCAQPACLGSPQIGPLHTRRVTRVAALSKCDVVSIVRAAGIPEAKVAAMTCTAFYESSWNPSATNHNTNGSTDYGLFQVNNNYWCSDPSESLASKLRLSPARLPVAASVVSALR